MQFIVEPTAFLAPPRAAPRRAAPRSAALRRMAGLELRYTKLCGAARIDAPRPGDVGYDVYSVEDVVGEEGDDRVLRRVRTGLSLAAPDGHYIRVAPRSGLSAKQDVSVEAGVVDPSYRGELIVLLRAPRAASFPAGTKVAQLVLERCSTPPLRLVESLEETERGAEGFGSTG